ncbi:MAG: hypothetical protein IJY25_04310 [Bacilli bacterium]|nr:hypothetical protein [Bacilli bacterium]
MLTISATSIIISTILICIIILCTIGIVIASIFQSKKDKKYKECLDIIKEKGNIKFEVRDALTKEDIKNINKNIDVNKLMESLYNKYLKFIEKIKNNDTKLDSILGSPLKEIYINKLENFKSTGYTEIIEVIELIGYTITDYSKDKLTFRITINCFDYKLLNGNIIGGSNLIKLEEVFLLTYEKIGNRWLITNCDKVYEKKLSD